MLQYSVTNPHSFVILASVSTYVMNIIHSLNTGKYRKLSKIGYPAAYASPEQVKDNQDGAFSLLPPLILMPLSLSMLTVSLAYLFNCAQRSHANFTENHVAIVVPMLITGLQYPITSAILGFSWSISRYIYMKGYCSLEQPSGRGRYNGATYYISQAGFLGLSVWMAVEMLMRKYM